MNLKLKMLHNGPYQFQEPKKLCFPVIQCGWAKCL